MSKVTERTYFDTTTACSDCGWWQRPWTRSYMRYTCCPDCGASVSKTVGKFKVRETRRFLCDTHTEYLSFTPRVPQP